MEKKRILKGAGKHDAKLSSNLIDEPNVFKLGLVSVSNCGYNYQ